MGSLFETEYLSDGRGTSLSELLVLRTATRILHHQTQMARVVAFVECLLLRDGDVELMDREVFTPGVSGFNDTDGIHACDSGRLVEATEREVGPTAGLPRFNRANGRRRDELQVSHWPECFPIRGRYDVTSRLHARLLVLPAC